MRAAGDVGLATDNRLDPAPWRFLIKFDRPVKIAVVGNRHRRHLIFTPFSSAPAPDRPVEKRIFGVEMEVNEGIAGHLEEY